MHVVSADTQSALAVAVANVIITAVIIGADTDMLLLHWRIRRPRRPHARTLAQAVARLDALASPLQMSWRLLDVDAIGTSSATDVAGFLAVAFLLPSFAGETCVRYPLPLLGGNPSPGPSRLVGIWNGGR